MRKVFGSLIVRISDKVQEVGKDEGVSESIVEPRRTVSPADSGHAWGCIPCSASPSPSPSPRISPQSYLHSPMRLFSRVARLFIKPKSPQLHSSTPDTLMKRHRSTDKTSIANSSAEELPKLGSLVAADNEADALNVSITPEMYSVGWTEDSVEGSMLAKSASTAEAGHKQRGLESIVAWRKLLEADTARLQCVSGSVAVLAEIPLRSPQKIFIFIIKKKCWLKVSKNKTI